MISEQQVMQNLDTRSGLTAKEMAARLNCNSSEVNPHLYRMLRTGKVRKDDLKWFLIKPNPKVFTAKLPMTKPGPPPLDIKVKTANSSSSSTSVSLTNPKNFAWTTEQSAIIDAPKNDRVLVEAGPGTGKTAVACARVAKLLRVDEITPSSILMISFTRTAVAEMKNRIRLWADSGKVNAVNISTLDQAAFSFGIGCGSKFESLMDGFEGNIQNAVEQFRAKNPLLIEYAANLEHVIIDEAQDLTGPRSQLVRLLLESLPATTGVTIFADEAQAIYGFTTDMDGDVDSSERFLQVFDPAKQGFTRGELQKIHRSQEPLILKLFAESRKALLEGTIEKVIQVAEAATQCLGSEVQDLPLRDGDLVLYRKRASALMHAQFCPKLFRLRLPNHPAAIFPWIGLVFSNWTAPLVSRSEFDGLWEKHVPHVMNDGFDASSAWALLHRFARDRDQIKTSRLRTLLSRPRPPVEFCYLDYGGHGPVFSTIHASKGREADRVFLMLPNNLKFLDGNSKIDRVEEARVFYVGSTRVKGEFLRGKAKTMAGAGRIDSAGRRVGQILSLEKWPKFQIGLAGDLDDVAPIGRIATLCDSDSAAANHQKFLVETWRTALTDNVCPEISGTCEHLAVGHGKKEYRFHFKAGTSSIAWSGSGLHKDLWAACSLMQQRTHCGDLRPPDEIKNLRLIGLRTCAVGEDPAVLGNLREPFASSGFWLAPMIVGFPSIFLRFQHH
jgi:hypothetical protein